MLGINRDIIQLNQAINMLVRISLFPITELSLKVNLLLYICNRLAGEKDLTPSSQTSPGFSSFHE